MMSSFKKTSGDHSESSTLVDKRRQSFPVASIQTKLTIGRPNDKYEKEADRVADQVVNSAPTQKAGVQKKPAAANDTPPNQSDHILQKMEEDELQTKPIPNLMRTEEEETQPGLQRMPMPDDHLQTRQNSQVTQIAPQRIQAKIQQSKGGGSPLSISTRSFMESRIGADFGKVRIHNDSNAHKLSAKLNAQAFATGNNIFFNQGKYNPETRSGKHLLAHELTHTVQQSAGMQMVQKQDKEKPAEKKYCLGTMNCHTIKEMAPKIAEEYWQRFYGAITLISVNAPKGQLIKREKEGEVVYDKLDDSNLSTLLEFMNQQYADAIAIVDGALQGDAGKKTQLRKAYAKAVMDTMKLAEKDINPPPPKPGKLIRLSHRKKGFRSYLQIYQQNRSKIHSFAWPKGKVDAGADTLLSGLTQKERLKLQIGETPFHLSNDALKSSFEKGTRHGLSPDVYTIQISPNIPAQLHEGLKNVAQTFDIGKVMMPNTTQSVVMDLTRFGGNKLLYRFTNVWNGKKGEKAKYRILIDGQGTVGIEGLGAPDKKLALAKLKKHGIQAEPHIFSGDEEYELFLRVIHALPDALLSKVKGLRFLRAPVNPANNNTAGDYDENVHTITLYNKAFEQTSIRHGSAISPRHPAMLTIVHEIGHALDVREIRPLDQKIQRLNIERNKLIEQSKDKPLSKKEKDQLYKEIDGKATEIKVLRKKLLKLKSPSGEYEGKNGPLSTQRKTDRKNTTEFRKTAAKESNVRITKYAESGWDEAFAEVFSLYASSPKNLKLLRPKLYALMNKKHGFYPD